ncbi:hypothetical protein ACFL2C_04170 [Patescibacteria group bacterium]
MAKTKLEQAEVLFEQRFGMSTSEYAKQKNKAELLIQEQEKRHQFWLKQQDQSTRISAVVAQSRIKPPRPQPDLKVKRFAHEEPQLLRTKDSD